MMADLKTPQAKKAFQLSIASITQQMATGNLKDGATIDNAYKTATDIDRQTMATDPAYKATMAEAEAEGTQRGKQKADQEKANKTVNGIGEIMDTLETLGHDQNVDGAIGPTEGKDWVQGFKGTLPSFFGAGPSYDLHQKIDSAQKNLQLIMTRLMMSGQGNISEGERSIVNEAIGNLSASSTPEAYLDNVRYLRELMGGIFDQDVPSQYNEPSSMKGARSKLMDAERAKTDHPAAADGSTPAPTDKAQVSARAGPATATIPTTGEKFELRNGAWVSLGVPKPTGRLGPGFNGFGG